MDWLLAKIVNTRPAAPAIGALREPNCHLVITPDKVIAELVSYYADLYTSKVSFTQDELDNYLQHISMPLLTDAQRIQLEAPITLEELKEVNSSFLASKATWDDGLPIEA